MKRQSAIRVLLLGVLLDVCGVLSAGGQEIDWREYPRTPAADMAVTPAQGYAALPPHGGSGGSQVQFLYAEDDSAPLGVLPEPDDNTEPMSISEQIRELGEQYSSLSEELEAVKETQGELEEAHEHFVVPGVSDATMRLSGRIHADYWAFPGDSPGVNAFETGDPLITPQDRFGFRRLRFGVAGTLPADMVYKIEMEFAGGNDVEFRDAYLGWEELPVLQTLLIGNQKRPYGLDHLNSSRYNVFLERPFIVEAFNQDARRLGIQSWGFSQNLAYNWRYGIFNQRLIQDEGDYVSDHYQLEVAGRFANTFYYDEYCNGRNYGHWAVSGSIADPDGSAGADPATIGFGRAANEARFRTRPEARSTSRWLDTGRIDGAEVYGLFGAEGVLNAGPLQFVGEYMNVWLDRDPGFGDDLHFHGGYVYLSYFLTGEHIPWDREEGILGRVEPFRNFYFVGTRPCRQLCGLGAWQVALRWSYADLTDDDILGGIGESVTAGLNWHWTPYARMQFNYIYGEIHDHFPVAGLTAGTYHIFGTRVMVDF